MALHPVRSGGGSPSALERWRITTLVVHYHVVVPAQWQGHTHLDDPLPATLAAIIPRPHPRLCHTLILVWVYCSQSPGGCISSPWIHEALLFAGRDTTGLVWVDSVRIDPQDVYRSIAFKHGSPTDTIHFRKG